METVLDESTSVIPVLFENGRNLNVGITSIGSVWKWRFQGALNEWFSLNGSKMRAKIFRQSANINWLYFKILKYVCDWCLSVAIFKLLQMGPNFYSRCSLKKACHDDVVTAASLNAAKVIGTALQDGHYQRRKVANIHVIYAFYTS